MPDPMLPRHDAMPEPPAGVGPPIRPDRPASDADRCHRLTARLAALDLDPATVEILTAVLTADLDLGSGVDDGR